MSQNKIIQADSSLIVWSSYLTNGLTSLERFPISFKTQFSGHCFHHVVLGVYCNGRYGSLGMSRRQDLMDKPLMYRTLGELVAEFESSYKRYQHTLKKVGSMEGQTTRGGLRSSESVFINSFLLLTGEDWLVRASRPPCLPAYRMEAFGAERSQTWSSGDEEGTGETRPGHEDEGTSCQSTLSAADNVQPNSSSFHS